MVKRMLIAIAVVALVATSVQAADPNLPANTKKYDNGWPVEYIAIGVCDIPVYMDVGMYVQVKDCHKREIKLVQVNCVDDLGMTDDDFPCYNGCDDQLEIRANFAAVLGTKLSKSSVFPATKWEGYYLGGNTVPGDGVYRKYTVCVKAWKTEIWNSAPGDKVSVGTCTVTVKPQ